MNYIHIGNRIDEVRQSQHLTKRALGKMVGLSESAIVHSSNRASMDVRTLHKIGVALGYDFFKHFPITDPKREPDERDKKIEEMEKRISELEKVNAELEREKKENAFVLDMAKKENGYLNEINQLLRGAKVKGEK